MKTAVVVCSGKWQFAGGRSYSSSFEGGLGHKLTFTLQSITHSHTDALSSCLTHTTVCLAHNWGKKPERTAAGARRAAEKSPNPEDRKPSPFSDHKAERKKEKGEKAINQSIGFSPGQPTVFSNKHFSRRPLLQTAPKKKQL